ncbi:MAG: AAA family ATPase [Eubacterium sp.]|nr:AAA family ATPase [Eubacterium sp.]
MYQIYESHFDRLPFVRIRKVELTNFKGVEHGVLEMNCAREFVPYDTESDILGLYGQNGSGKSSLVEALYLVKGIIGGYRLGGEFERYIDVAAENATISVEFEFQYTDGTVATVAYEVKLESKENSEESLGEEKQQKDQRRLYIYDEIIRTDLYEDGRVGRMHTIVDTKNRLLCGDSLEKYYYDREDKKIREELTYQKRKQMDGSYSFVFAQEVSDILSKKNSDGAASKYYEILAELELYITNYLFVIGTSITGLVHMKAAIPIFTPVRDRPIILMDQTVISKKRIKYVEKTFKVINTALATIIPDLQLELRTTPTVTNEGEDGYFVKVLSVRGDRVFPFNYESDGIIKLVSIMADFVFAYNQGSATLVVDEFDAGVFEYLLGELLQIFEKSGKGQLIFTSHNLRPLEVIDKKFIRFTTSDPENRYYRLKNVGSTNNLRDLYLREVQLGNLDVEMYRRTKSFKISKAMSQAGKEMDSSDGV